jgi:PIN domain-containing protein
MRRLLIDTNIYLEFFRFSKDDLEELRKLAELIRVGEIQLYMNQQLRNEFRRNRAKTLAAALRSVREAKIPATFPQVLRNYQRFAKLDTARRQYAAEVDKLLERAREDAARRRLPADELLDELFGLATDLHVTAEIIQLAKDRFDRGNPPGKVRSYGDAITWETLLHHHPEHVSLDVITSDSDYLSPLRRMELQEFLEAEWQQVKQSHVEVFENLTTFFQKHYPDIKLSTEVAGELAVAALESSGSFASTHGAIASLSKIGDFSSEQVQRLIDAAFKNDQVGMIIHDADVKEFFERLLATFGDEAEPASVMELRRWLQEDEDA